MSHYISRIVLDRAGRGAAMQEVAHLFASGHPGHALAWKAFATDDGEERRFLFRQEQRARGLGLTAVSSKAPHDWGGRLRVETKPYDPKLRPGQKLRFSVRVNPTVSKMLTPGARGKRCDAMIDHIRGLKAQGQQGPFDRAALSQEVGLRWLSSRAKRGGFRVVEEDFGVEGYESVSFRKKWGKGPEVTLARMDMTGVLEVEEPEAFCRTLFEGIGSAKGYGHGLMLVRPA